ncbi:unnamed protein product [Coffea canephora]|uniref:Uncharacterized protein n=1 Tax=Coffea canephora TaxID=49390 RepID=A0A068U267_COFCA|nr:unnamed protein product [Coffea canephora]
MAMTKICLMPTHFSRSNLVNLKVPSTFADQNAEENSGCSKYNLFNSKYKGCLYSVWSQVLLMILHYTK